VGGPGRRRRASKHWNATRRVIHKKSKKKKEMSAEGHTKSWGRRTGTPEEKKKKRVTLTDHVADSGRRGGSGSVGGVNKERKTELRIKSAFTQK